jgi:hypothetical protein
VVGQIDVTNITRAVDCCPQKRKERRQRGQSTDAKSTRYQYRLSCPCKRLSNLVFVLKADGYLLRVSVLERLRCCSIVCTYFITVRKERRRMTESNDRTRR